MAWLERVISLHSLIMLIPVSLIVSVFAYAALKAHYKHIERLERIKQGLDTDY